MRGLLEGEARGGARVPLAIFAAGMLGGPWLLEGADWRLRASVGGLAVVALIVIVGVKTRGGMRWRWGQD